MATRLVPIMDVGRHGVIKDRSSIDLPPGAWTDVKNVVFREGVISKKPPLWATDSAALGVEGPTSICAAGSRVYLMQIGPLAYSYNHNAIQSTASSFYDVTRVSGNYGFGSDSMAQSTLYNGYVIFNMRAEVPQSWKISHVGYDNYPVDIQAKLVDLVNWPNIIAHTIRAYKNHLVAMNILFNGPPVVYSPGMVKWSHSAAYGSLPSSWDPTDATKEAGEVILTDEYGDSPIYDCLPLGQSNIVYSSNAAWRMDYVGFPYIFAFRQLHTTGLIARECVVSFQGAHFAVGQDDIVIHDGTTVISKCEGSIRRYFFNDLSNSLGSTTVDWINNFYLNYKTSFTRVVKVDRLKEIWVMYQPAPVTPVTAPLGTYPTMYRCTKALIWNWATDTWTITDLPFLSGVVQNDLIGAGLYEQPHVLACSYSTKLIYALDSTLFPSGAVDEACWFIRTGLCPSINQKGEVYQNPRSRRMVSAVWPHISAPDGTVFTIVVGSQEHLDDAVTWYPSKTFTVGTDVKVELEPPVEGRFIAIDFSTTGKVNFSFQGYSLDMTELGEL